MNWKNLYLIFILGIALFFSPVQKVVFSSEVYFVPREITRHLLDKINGSKETLDIAVSEITSRKILGALADAQARGVKIRIVIDRQRSFTHGPLSDKENNFSVRIVVQKGSTRHNFAIFDSQLLMTGSYHWKERVSEFDRENVLFLTEPKVLIKYQKEFDYLFFEGQVADREKRTLRAEKKMEKFEERPIEEKQKPTASYGKVIALEYGIVIRETDEGYLDMNFEEFNTVFGMVSELSDAQKERLWLRCVGKKVKWRGKTRGIGRTLLYGRTMNVMHGDTSVEVKLDSAHKDHFSKVKYGNTVTYTGRLESRVTRVFPYKLTDGDVLLVEDTFPDPLREGELLGSPFTPQGPEKIFLIQGYEDFDTLFGGKSSLSEEQKKKEWEKYEGKYVSWTGKISYIKLDSESGLQVGILRNNKTCLELDCHVSKKNKLSQLKEGETVYYSGKLTTLWGKTFPYSLKDGDVFIMR
ncbi:MAG: phospholipase D-like domain-containing protein [Candidatus Brocadiaceae bacterium]|nr:phospholipase D-like domain-containing protein [Candidatus Brocadiaceae bacterium]